MLTESHISQNGKKISNLIQRINDKVILRSIFLDYGDEQVRLTEEIAEINARQAYWNHKAQEKRKGLSGLGRILTVGGIAATITTDRAAAPLTSAAVAGAVIDDVTNPEAVGEITGQVSAGLVEMGAASVHGTNAERRKRAEVTKGELAASQGRLAAQQQAQVNDLQGEFAYAYARPAVRFAAVATGARPGCRRAESVATVPSGKPRLQDSRMGDASSEGWISTRL